MSKQTHVVISPASGQDQPTLNALNDVFQAFNVRWDISTNSLEKMIEAA